MPMTISFRKEGKQLVPNGFTDKLSYDFYVNNMKEGELVMVTYEPVHSDATYAQLAKIHACIRDMAANTGHSFAEIKKEMKEKAGLKIKGKLKSFSDCSKEELSQVIHTIIETGDELGYNYHG